MLWVNESLPAPLLAQVQLQLQEDCLTLFKVLSQQIWCVLVCLIFISIERSLAWIVL